MLVVCEEYERRDREEMVGRQDNVRVKWDRIPVGFRQYILHRIVDMFVCPCNHWWSKTGLKLVPKLLKPTLSVQNVHRFSFSFTVYGCHRATKQRLDNCFRCWDVSFEHYCTSSTTVLDCANNAPPMKVLFSNLNSYGGFLSESFADYLTVNGLSDAMSDTRSNSSQQSRNLAVKHVNASLSLQKIGMFPIFTNSEISFQVLRVRKLLRNSLK